MAKRSIRSCWKIFIYIARLAGIRIFCTQERTQLKNKERALSLLRAKLFELETEKQRAEISARRKSQVLHPQNIYMQHTVLKQLLTCAPSDNKSHVCSARPHFFSLANGFRKYLKQSQVSKSY